MNIYDKFAVKSLH